MKNKFTRAGAALLEGGMVAILAVGLLAGSAFAARPTGGGTVKVADGVYAGTSAVQTGGASWWAHARCSQDGIVVYEQWVKTDLNGRGTFNLGPTPMWTAGAASCWAEDGTWQNSRWRGSSTTTFNVSG